MKKILNIISSPRGEASNSIKLANALLEKLNSQYPNSIVKQKNLTKDQPPHLNNSHLEAFFTSAEKRTNIQNQIVNYSDESIKELMDSDILVIGAPMYNFSFPSTLKAWLDQIIRVGFTFKYTSKGPVGLVLKKKVYLIITSGGIYSEGSGQDNDYLTSYLKFVLSFVGMNDVTVVRGEGFALPELQDVALENAMENITI